MTENEKAIYDVIYLKCWACYMETHDWYGWTARETIAKHPPKPEEFAGYITDKGIRSCKYCMRVAKFVTRIPGYREKNEKKFGTGND